MSDLRGEALYLCVSGRSLHGKEWRYSLRPRGMSRMRNVPRGLPQCGKNPHLGLPPRWLRRPVPLWLIRDSMVGRIKAPLSRLNEAYRSNRKAERHGSIAAKLQFQFSRNLQQNASTERRLGYKHKKRPIRRTFKGLRGVFMEAMEGVKIRRTEGIRAGSHKCLIPRNYNVRFPDDV